MSASGSSGGPGLATLLTVLFVGLKLTGHITWSWVWVLSPVWIPLGLVFVVVMVAAAGSSSNTVRRR